MHCIRNRSKIAYLEMKKGTEGQGKTAMENLRKQSWKHTKFDQLCQQTWPPLEHHMHWQNPGTPCMKKNKIDISHIYHLPRTAKNKGRAWWTFESSVYATAQTSSPSKSTSKKEIVAALFIMDVNNRKKEEYTLYNSQMEFNLSSKKTNKWN